MYTQANRPPCTGASDAHIGIWLLYLASCTLYNVQYTGTRLTCIGIWLLESRTPCTLYNVQCIMYRDKADMHGYMALGERCEQTNEERSHNRPTLPYDELMRGHDATRPATTHLHKTLTIRLKVGQQGLRKVAMNTKACINKWNVSNLSCAL